MSRLALGAALPTAARSEVIRATESFTQANSGAGWKGERVKQAALLVFATPAYQVQR
jgi:hypothetical protein